MELDRLHSALSDRFFHLELRDRTIPPGPVGAGGRDSLEGRYFQILQQAAQNAAGPEAGGPCAWPPGSAAKSWRDRR